MHSSSAEHVHKLHTFIEQKIHTNHGLLHTSIN